jgi:hypothetical protein
MTKYTLFDGSEPVRTLDNREGCKLSALFRVAVGDQVTWKDAVNEPAQVALEYGYVNGLQRFRVCML